MLASAGSHTAQSASVAPGAWERDGRRSPWPFGAREKRAGRTLRGELPALWHQGERVAPGPLVPGRRGGLRGEPLAPGPLALGKGKHPGPFGAWERGGATLPATLQKLKGCMFSSFKNLKGCR